MVVSACPLDSRNPKSYIARANERVLPLTCEDQAATWDSVVLCTMSSSVAMPSRQAASKRLPGLLSGVGGLSHRSNLAAFPSCCPRSPKQKVSTPA